MEKTKSMNKIKGRTLFSYVMMGPYLIIFLIFTVIPVAAAIVLSFTDFNMLQWPRFTGIENYLNLFLNDDVFITVIKNTFIFALITGPLGYVMSFLLAWMINEFQKPVRMVLTVIFYGPTLAGVMYYIWQFLFSGDAYGLINSWLMRLGIINAPLAWLYDARYAPYIVMIIILWASSGAGFLAFLAGMQTTDKSLSEAGAIDGIQNRWQELRKITIPQMGPQLMFGAVMAIGSSFTVGGVSIALMGLPSTDYSTDTIVTHMYDFGFIRLEMGYASAIAVILFIIMVLVKQLITKMLKRYM